MKKTFLFGLALLGFTMAKAQDADKSFRFGLKISPSINWLKIDDEKTFTKGGALMKFGYGLITEFKITDVAWFTTGFQVDYDGGKIEMTDSMGYYYNESKDGFLENKKVDYADASTYTGYDYYQLHARRYNSMYLSLPLQLRLKTKEIGYLTYFGNIGLLTSVHIRTRANDDVTFYTSSGQKTSQTVEKLDISSDMNFMKTGLVIGGGCEFNLSGSTSMIFGLSYNQGFMNIVKKDSKYIIDEEKTITAIAGGSTKPVAQAQKFLGQNVTLMIGILF